MYVYCVYPAMSKNLSDLNKKHRNKRHSSPFINVVKGVFFVVRDTLVLVSYLSAPSAVHSYRVPGKFIRIVWKVYSSSTNKVKIYSYSIFVQQMYWLQDKTDYHDIAEILLTVVLNTITLTLCIFTHSWNSSSLFLLHILKPASLYVLI